MLSSEYQQESLPTQQTLTAVPTNEPLGGIDNKTGRVVVPKLKMPIKEAKENDDSKLSTLQEVKEHGKLEEMPKQIQRLTSSYQKQTKIKMLQLKKLERVQKQHAEDYQAIQRDMQMLQAILRSGMATTSMLDNRVGRVVNAPLASQLAGQGMLQGHPGAFSGTGYPNGGGAEHQQAMAVQSGYISRQDQRFQDQRLSPLDVSAQQQPAVRNNFFFSCTPYSNRLTLHQQPGHHAASGTLGVNTASSNFLLSHRSKSKEESASTLPHARKLETCACPKARHKHVAELGSQTTEDKDALLCEECCCVVCDDLKNSRISASIEVGEVDRDNSLEKNCLSQDAIQKLKLGGGAQSASGKQNSCQIPSKVQKQRTSQATNAMSLILQGKASNLHYPTGGANSSTPIAGYKGLEVLKSHRSNLSQHRQSSQNSRGNKAQAKQFSGGGGIELTLRRQQVSNIEITEEVHHNGGDETDGDTARYLHDKCAKSACNIISKEYQSQELRKRRDMSTEARLGVEHRCANFFADMNATLEERKLEREGDSKQFDILQGLQQSELGQPINIGQLFNNSSTAVGQFTNQLGAITSRSPKDKRHDQNEGTADSHKNSPSKSNQAIGLPSGTASGPPRGTRKQGLGGCFGKSQEGITRPHQLFNMKQTTHTPPPQDSYLAPRTPKLSQYQATTSAANLAGPIAPGTSIQLAQRAASASQSQSQINLHLNQVSSYAQLHQQSSDHTQSQPRLQYAYANPEQIPFSAQSPIYHANQPTSLYEAIGIIRTALAKVDQMQAHISSAIKTELGALTKTRAKMAKRKRRLTAEKSAGGLTQRQRTARGQLTSRFDDESGSLSYRTNIDLKYKKEILAPAATQMVMHHPVQCYYGVAPPSYQALPDNLFPYQHPYRQLSLPEHQMLFDQYQQQMAASGWTPEEDDPANEAPFMTINNETSAENNKSSCLMLASSTGAGNRPQTERAEHSAQPLIPANLQQLGVPAKEPFHSQNIVVLPSNAPMNNTETRSQASVIQKAVHGQQARGEGRGVDQNIFYCIGQSNSRCGSKVGKHDLSFNNSSSATFLNNTGDKHTLSTSPQPQKLNNLMMPIARTSAKRGKIGQETPSLRANEIHASDQQSQAVTSTAFKSRNWRGTAGSHDKIEVLAAQTKRKRNQLNKFYEKLDRISPVLSSYPSQKKESSQKANDGFNADYEHIIGESGLSVARAGETEGDLDEEERQQLILMTHTFDDILQAKKRTEQPQVSANEIGTQRQVEEEDSKKKRGRRVSAGNKKAGCASSSKKKQTDAATRGFQIPKLNLNKVLGGANQQNKDRPLAQPTLFSESALSPVHQLMTAQVQVVETQERCADLTASKKKTDTDSRQGSMKSKSQRKRQHNHQPSKSLSTAKLYSKQFVHQKSPQQPQNPGAALLAAKDGSQQPVGRQHLQTIQCETSVDVEPQKVVSQHKPLDSNHPVPLTIRLKEKKNEGIPQCPSTQRHLVKQMASLLKQQLKSQDSQALSKRKFAAQASSLRRDQESSATARSGQQRTQESKASKKRLPAHHANMLTTILNTARMSSQSSRSRQSRKSTQANIITTDRSSLSKPKATGSRFDKNILISCQGHDANSVPKAQHSDLRSNIAVITPRMNSNKPKAAAPTSSTVTPAANKGAGAASRKKQELSTERQSTSKPASVKRRHFETAQEHSSVPNQAGAGTNTTIESLQRKRKVALLDLSGVAGASSGAGASGTHGGSNVQAESLTKDLRILNKQLLLQQQKLNVNTLQTCVTSLNYPQTCKNNDNAKLSLSQGLFGKGGSGTPRGAAAANQVPTQHVVSSARVSQERKLKRIPSGARRLDGTFKHSHSNIPNSQVATRTSVLSPASTSQQANIPLAPAHANNKFLFVGPSLNESGTKEQKTLSPQRKSVEKIRKSDLRNTLNIKVKKETAGQSQVARIKQVTGATTGSQIVGRKIQVKLKTGQVTKLKQVQTTRAGTNDTKGKLLFSTFIKDLQEGSKNIKDYGERQPTHLANATSGTLDFGSGHGLKNPKESDVILINSEDCSIKNFQTTSASIQKSKQ